MRSSIAVVLLGASAALATPVDKRAYGGIQFMVGQNYQNEWDDFAKGFGKTPAGISLYGDIFGTGLNTDSQALIKSYAAKYSGMVELGLSWKDNMAQNGYADKNTAKLQTDIAAGKFNKGLDAVIAQLKPYNKLTFLIRPDYEVSNLLHANTDPAAWNNDTADWKAYPAAFRYVRNYIRKSLPNTKFMYHAVRSQAALLYPGDDVVDYQGISIFNNDVCLECGGTYGCKNPARLDDGIKRDFQFSKKPLWVAESACQPPACSTPKGFIDYMTRIKEMVEKNNFAGWTYINSDWIKHGWDKATWGDSRLEANPEVKEWFSKNIATNPKYTWGK